MTFTAVDCHGFGGGFTLGAVQAGFKLVGKMSRDQGFGVYNTLANRQLLGHDWESIIGVPNWRPVKADMVFGNPPCSGFSTLSRKEFRGMDSTINECMWELVRYAGSVVPPIVAWESVQQTFRQGLPLMRQLHDALEEISGHKYVLHHVLHNNAAHGGVSIRKRYFWVASRIPFGVELDGIKRDGSHYDVTRVPTFGDMLRDLAPLGMSMAPQRYRGMVERQWWDGDDWQTSVGPGDTSWWCEREAHDGTGLVDGHQRMYSPSIERTLQAIDGYQGHPGTYWNQGERACDVLRRYEQTFGHLPPSWDYMTTKEVDGEKVKLKKSDRLRETDYAMGHNQLMRWRSDKMARVITGGACHLVLHPWLDRTLTQREAARIQGFPDEWKIFPVRTAPDLGPGWGKGVPVQAGRWISAWALKSLSGSPGALVGEPLTATHPKLAKQFGSHDRELVIDLAHAYKPLARKIGDLG